MSSRAKADDLRRAGRFDEAVKEYAAIWPDDDKWTGWGYSFCLRKLGRTQDALKVAREVHSLDSSFLMGRSILAWVLYDIHIKGVDPAEERMRTAAREVVTLVESDPQRHERTSPFVPVVLRMAKYWETKGRSLNVLKWLGKLEPDRLSTEPFKRTDERGRPQEVASPRERYYSRFTHALQRLGRWQECLEAATHALTNCGRLHHDNDVWFGRRVALAKLELGIAKEALEELQRLVRRKPSGFLETDIARAAWALDDLDHTFEHALKAIISPDEMEFKLEAARLLANVLWRRGEKDAARAHIRLCLAVRSKSGWRIPEDLRTTALEWQIDLVDQDPKVLIQDLRPLWSHWRELIEPRKSGAIVRVLPHGRAGFIRAESGEQFYFDSRDAQQRKWRPTAGTRVTFSTRPGFDTKRRRSTTVACDVTLVSGRVDDRLQ